MSKIYTISILLIIIEIPTVKANMRFFFLSVYYSIANDINIQFFISQKLKAKNYFENNLINQA
jgi:hypothetical protein